MSFTGFRTYDNAMKQNPWFDRFNLSLANLKLWQKHKRWGGCTFSLEEPIYLPRVAYSWLFILTNSEWLQPMLLTVLTRFWTSFCLQHLLSISTEKLGLISREFLVIVCYLSTRAKFETYEQLHSRFKAELCCTAYSGSIVFGRSGEQILGMSIHLTYKYSALYLVVTFWIANFDFQGSALLDLRTKRSFTLSDYFEVNHLLTRYEYATKQSRFRVPLSFIKLWQKCKRWGKITPSRNISEVLMKRIDKHCSLLAFKFPAVITGRVNAIIGSLENFHCNFPFLSRYIFCL